MNLVQLWAEIEQDLTWRVDEIRFFQNQLARLESPSHQDQFRRALVLLLYAHFEGFCKFAFLLYISAINDEGVLCRDANYAIAAAALSDLFAALRNPEAKCAEFRNLAPDDRKLHLFAREREFIERTSEFAARRISIPDTYVDTESNLTPVVLRKNLYKLGFAHDAFLDSDGVVHHLVNYRNKIAHGELSTGIQLKVYGDLRDASFKVMAEVKGFVMTALTEKSYLRSA